MDNRNKMARIAGLLYLVVVITGMFSLAYVPKQLFIWDDPAKTFTNIRGNESLFRMSLASSVICYIAFIFLPVVLYRLLRSVNERQAKVMALLAIISAPISFINLQNKYAILDLLAVPENADLSGLQNQVMLYLNQYNNGILITTIFWGLWLLPFGYLVYKSDFLPRLLGIFLMLGCFGYLINFFGNTLSLGYGSTGIPGYLRMLPAIGEIGTCLWLLCAGAKNWRSITGRGR